MPVRFRAHIGFGLYPQDKNIHLFFYMDFLWLESDIAKDTGISVVVGTEATRANPHQRGFHVPAPLLREAVQSAFQRSR